MEDPNGYGIHFEKSNVKGCSTVDITDTDNGYLDCARNGRPSHETTKKAISNILDCKPTGVSCHIIGHGEPGVIITGTGQQVVVPEKYMGLDNRDSWHELLASLGKEKISNLYLLGCDIGAEQEGADLLYEMAQIVNADVVAPTGFVECDRVYFSLEARATWQVAGPKNKPDPVPAPRAPLYEYTRDNIFVFNKKYTQEISKEQVLDIYVRKTAQEEWNKLNHHLLPIVYSLIDFSHPIDLRGIPSGLISGMLRFEYQWEKEKVVKEFHILNNRLVIDKDFALIGYYCKPAISGFF